MIVSPFSFLDSPAGDVKVFFSEAYFFVFCLLLLLHSPMPSASPHTHTHTTQTQRLGFSAFVDARALG